METPNGFYYDHQAYLLVENFFEKLLKHVKGEWAGKPFILSDWQKEEILKPLFGMKRPDGTRQYRTAYIEIPRKNGKSSLAAGIALYLLFADGEMGGEIVSAAADRDQAHIVYDLAKQMTEESPELKKRAHIYKRTIVFMETRSTYKVLSADAFTKHGLNISGGVVDELHVQPNRDLVDTIETATGSRSQPLIVFITTAGFDKNSICYEKHEYADQILRGIIEDPSFFAYIRAADPEDDIFDEKTWKKANPGFGVTVKRDYLKNQAKRAQLTPAFENTFRRLHLNQWTSQETRWLPMEAWDRCGDPFDPKLLEGSICYGGLDLASSSDLASFVLDFPSEAGEERESHAWLAWFWIPEENMVERSRTHRVNYETWVKQGLITATEGNVIDYDFIVRDIEALGEIYNIREIAFDRWGAFQVSRQLEGAGFVMVGFGQGFVSMSAPTKELLRLVLDGTLKHNSNPVLRWNADNMVVSTDAAENVKPNKQKSRSKIDGMVAGIMALDRAMRQESGGSIYENRGLSTIQ